MAASDVTSNIGQTFYYIAIFISSPFIAIPFLGIFLHLFYLYFLVCIFAYARNNSEKRGLFITLGIGLFLIIAGSNMIFIHFYEDITEKRLTEQREGPYGSLEYHADWMELYNARIQIRHGNLDKAQWFCEHIKPEATFNNGEIIKDKCFDELNAV